MSKDSHEEEFDPLAALLEEVEDESTPGAVPSPPRRPPAAPGPAELRTTDPFDLHPAAAMRHPSAPSPPRGPTRQASPTSPAAPGQPAAPVGPPAPTRPAPPPRPAAAAPASQGFRAPQASPDPFGLHPAARLRTGAPGPARPGAPPPGTAPRGPSAPPAPAPPPSPAPPPDPFPEAAPPLAEPGILPPEGTPTPRRGTPVPSPFARPPAPAVPAARIQPPEPREEPPANLLSSGVQLIASLVADTDGPARRPPPGKSGRKSRRDPDQSLPPRSEERSGAPPAPKPAPSGSRLRPSWLPELDSRKVERLTLAGCSLGILALGAWYWLSPGPPPAPTWTSPAERLVSQLAAALPGEEAPDPLASFLAEREGQPFSEDPAALDRAALPGRATWLELLTRPEVMEGAAPELRERFQELLPGYQSLDRRLLEAGRSPAYPHSRAPLEILSPPNQRLGGYPETLGAMGGELLAPPRRKGHDLTLAALRDCTRSISRQATGATLEPLLGLLDIHGWSFRTAPPEALLGQPVPEPGGSSPRSLSFALLFLGRAREAGLRGETDQVSLLHAARILVTGFPTSPDPFGATWASAASLLYAQTGHDQAALEVTRAFLEKARRTTQGTRLGVRLVARLRTQYGERSPKALEKLWEELGQAPSPPGSARPGGPRTPNGLLGQVPRTQRIRGIHKGGSQLSEVEKKRRYRRYQRRRGRRRKG